MSELPVTVAWDRPEASARAIVVLAHGAGGDLNDKLLAGVGSSLAERGLAVARFNFPYREAGRKAPGSQAQSEDCYRIVAEAAREKGVALYCGGKSYGGRIASHIAADGFDMNGLLFLSYPLHPPGKPDRIRDAHLRSVGVPMLFVQGTRDPFAPPDLLEQTIGSLPAATHVAVEGGDHSLRVRGRSPAEICAQVTDAVAAFIAAT